MDDKKVPVITKDEAISKLRMFQSLIASQNWEDKECVVALQMGIRAIQQPELVRCDDCGYSFCDGFIHERLYCEKHPELGEIKGDWFCADCWKA